MYTETAVPMSEMEVADGQIPPWLLEDDGSNGAQVSAGTHTPAAGTDPRLLYPHPEPGEVAYKQNSGSTSQNQPPQVLADIPDVEPGVDPLSGSPIVFNQETQDYTPQQTDTKPTKTGGKKSGGKKTGGTKVTKPTMVTYKVRPGDSLSLIASRSHTTVEQIMKDSKLKSSTIHPGQVIKVRFTPSSYKKGGKTTTTKGGAKGSSKSAKGRTHTVTSGQTLSGIAGKYGVSVSSLMKANGLSKSAAGKIKPGQKLKIPAKG